MLIGVKGKKYTFLKGLEMNEVWCNVGFRSRSTQPTGWYTEDVRSQHERGSEKIAVEIKSFIAGSDINEFHTALGQYLNYCQALEENEPDRIVYLAVPHETYLDFCQLAFVQRTLQRHPSRKMLDSIYNSTFHLPPVHKLISLIAVARLVRTLNVVHALWHFVNYQSFVSAYGFDSLAMTNIVQFC